MEEEIKKIQTEAPQRTGGMTKLINKCKKCKGHPDTRIFNVGEYTGECCNDDSCMLVVRWEEIIKEEEDEVEN